MSVNIEKTSYMTFPHDKANETLLCINNQVINKVSSCRYLGVITDDELKWTDHINHLYKKLIKYCSIFYQLRSMLPIQVLKQVYFAFVHSRLLYAVEIYANTHKCYLEKLIKINNKLLRIIQNKPRKTHLTELYENYCTLPVPLLHQHNLILFAHKILHYPHKSPVLFQYYLSK